MQYIPVCRQISRDSLLPLLRDCRDTLGYAIEKDEYGLSFKIFNLSSFKINNLLNLVGFRL